MHCRAYPLLGSWKKEGKIGNENWGKHFSGAKRVLMWGRIWHRPHLELLPSFFFFPEPPFFLIFLHLQIFSPTRSSAFLKNSFFTPFLGLPHPTATLVLSIIYSLNSHILEFDEPHTASSRVWQHRKSPSTVLFHFTKVCTQKQPWGGPISLQTRRMDAKQNQLGSLLALI